jgi:hypothetical protein
MNDPTKILWEIVTKTKESKSDRSGWELKKGVKIFNNPEAKCPNCDTWIPTQRIWLVNESSGKLLGCWRADGSRVIADERKVIIHPHVYLNGNVCKGKTDSASTALFSGVDKGRHYHLTEHWFEQLGHICPNVKKVPCAWCGFLQFHEYCETYGDISGIVGDYKYLCSSDCLSYAQSLWCWICFSARDFYDPKVREKHLCSKCRDEGHRCQCCRCRRSMCRECSIMFRADDLSCDRLCRNCNGNEPDPNPVPFLCSHCEVNEVDEEDWICDKCLCRDCGEEVAGDNNYCSDHLYECQCDCECDARIPQQGLCNYCFDNCEQEEDEEEPHTCSCDSCGGCYMPVAEDGDACEGCLEPSHEEDE